MEETKIYKRFIEVLGSKTDFSMKLNELLPEWKVTENQERIMHSFQ